jgi:hypothetical protein
LLYYTMAVITVLVLNSSPFVSTTAYKGLEVKFQRVSTFLRDADERSASRFPIGREV